jgi:hypothetical protein
MQKLIEQRDQLLREMEAIRNKIAGLEMAISLLGTEGSSSTGRSQNSVKGVLLTLLKEVGMGGITASAAVEMANKRGITLHAGSVGSTLSRLKSMGVVVLDGNRYILSDFMPKEERPLNVVQPAAWGGGPAK